MDALLSMRSVGKCFETPAGPFRALSDVDLDIGDGEFVAIVGKSGSGKSTLVNCLTGIDAPTSGTITFGGMVLNGLDQDELALWRGRSVGVVFQFFQLLPTLTVAENVMLPMDFCNSIAPRLRRDRALSLLARLDVAAQADKLPADLSGGQQQRVAIARALANDPRLIVADEPTGNLDSQTADEVMALFAALAQEGRSVVMVTHERDLTRFFTRVVTLRDGRIVDAPKEGAKS